MPKYQVIRKQVLLHQVVVTITAETKEEAYNRLEAVEKAILRETPCPDWLKLERAYETAMKPAEFSYPGEVVEKPKGKEVIHEP